MTGCFGSASSAEILVYFSVNVSNRCRQNIGYRSESISLVNLLINLTKPTADNNQLAVYIWHFLF